MPTDDNPARQRLGSQQLTRPLAAAPHDVVRRMGALQAQDYGQSLWAIGCRVRKATVTDVIRAIEDRAILRTWPMRGTIHFVPAEDAAWMVALSAARTLKSDARRLAQLELDEAVVRRCQELLKQALAGGKRLARPRVMELFEAAGVRTDGQRGYHLLWHAAVAGVRTDGQRGYHLLWHAAVAGVICLGPMEGKQQTFVLLDEWVPDARVLPRELALAELARRYFTGHGPATVQDFAWWSGLTLTEARAGLAAVAAELFPRSVGGVEHWTGQAAVRRGVPGALLLAGFDEYLLGYRDRSAVLPARHANRIVPGNNGVFLPTMVLDGQVVGTWKRTVSARWVDVVLVPFETLGLAVEGFTAEAERYAAFTGLPLRSASVLPHDRRADISPNE